DSRLLYGMSPNTVQSYRSNADCYVYPYIGNMPYAQVRSADISNLYRELLLHGGRNGKGLSPQTIKKLHAFLSGCFKTLIEDGVIDSSIVAGVKTPRGSSPEAAALIERDLATLKGYLDQSTQKLDVAIMLALNTGVRRGELAGFYRTDFNPSAPSIRVARGLYQVRGDGGALTYKDPKSKKSKRILALDKDTARRLCDYLVRRDEEIRAAGISESQNAPLFPRSDGTPVRPHEYYDHLKRLVRDLKLDPSIKLHTLRHTHATYLLDSGVNIKDVQNRLGQSTINTTLNIYGHVLAGRDEVAAEAFAKLSRKIYVRRKADGEKRSQEL
ncbi:MAG: site-specific integrase, partial [Raoultibacter sp.]